MFPRLLRSPGSVTLLADIYRGAEDFRCSAAYTATKTILINRAYKAPRTAVKPSPREGAFAPKEERHDAKREFSRAKTRTGEA